MNLDRLKLFNLTQQMIVQDLEDVQNAYGIEILQKTDSYSLIEGFSQFEPSVMTQAKTMGEYYVIFYCLENSIRRLISGAFDAAHPEGWWNKGKYIPDQIYDEVEKRIARELEAGLTRRSEEKIDYTTFGELGQIIESNWTIFGSIFNSRKAVNKIINNLNGIRNNIAHCCMIAEDEVLRLKLTVRDWFRIQAG